MLPSATLLLTRLLKIEQQRAMTKLWKISRVLAFFFLAVAMGSKNFLPVVCKKWSTICKKYGISLSLPNKKRCRMLKPRKSDAGSSGIIMTYRDCRFQQGISFANDVSRQRFWIRCGQATGGSVGVELAGEFLDHSSASGKTISIGINAMGSCLRFGMRNTHTLRWIMGLRPTGTNILRGHRITKNTRTTCGCQSAQRKPTRKEPFLRNLFASKAAHPPSKPLRSSRSGPTGASGTREHLCTPKKVECDMEVPFLRA